MITIDNVQYRNLEEQVKKNMDDIKYILEEEGVLNEFGIKVVGQISSTSQLPDPDTYEGEFGDAYAVGTTAPYTFYIYTRANGGVGEPYWFNIGQFPLAGKDGAQGPTGPAGPQGVRGSTWQNGRSAPTSTSGFLKNDKYLNTSNGDVYNYTGTAWQRVMNIRGPQGIQGPQGNVGPAGPQGIQGPKGDKGDPGPAFVIAGTLANEGQLPDPSTLADNIAYLVGSDNDYDLYVQLQDSDTWQNVGKVEGVQGPTGPTGPQGPQGPQGEGVPSGGTAGQFLQRTATGTTWANVFDILTADKVGTVNITGTSGNKQIEITVDAENVDYKSVINKDLLLQMSPDGTSDNIKVILLSIYEGAISMRLGQGIELISLTPVVYEAYTQPVGSQTKIIVKDVDLVTSYPNGLSIANLPDTAQVSANYGLKAIRKSN